MRPPYRRAGQEEQSLFLYSSLRHQHQTSRAVGWRIVSLIPRLFLSDSPTRYDASPAQAHYRQTLVLQDRPHTAPGQSWRRLPHKSPALHSPRISLPRLHLTRPASTYISRCFVLIYLVLFLLTTSITMDKSAATHMEVATFPDSHVVDSYAVDAKDEQVTVIGTMGQDPDHKQPVSWRAWAIVSICALATFQVRFALCWI